MRASLAVISAPGRHAGLTGRAGRGPGEAVDPLAAAGQVDGALGLACAHQHAAELGTEREDVAGPHQVSASSEWPGTAGSRTMWPQPESVTPMAISIPRDNSNGR